MTTRAATVDTNRTDPPHRCPWWVGYLLANPLRRFFENPDKLLAPHVAAGDTVVDLGCAMGFFSFPLADLVGPGGRVVCVDVQPRMLTTLGRRVRRKRKEAAMETRLCEEGDLGLGDLAGGVDVAVAWHVVHEVSDRGAFIGQCHRALRPGGRLLLAEPTGHVSEKDMAAELDMAREAGFRVAEVQRNRRNLVAVLIK
jgi:SAM-dependent methyltransferase